MRQACGFVGFHAHVPDLGRFHLRHFEAVKERRRGMQSLDPYCVHRLVFFFSAAKADRERKHLRAGSLSSRPLQRGVSSRSRDKFLKNKQYMH
jgi:hypothetical protein